MAIHKTAAIITVVLTALTTAIVTVVAMFVLIPRVETVFTHEILIATIFQHAVGVLSFMVTLFLAFAPKYRPQWFTPETEPPFRVLLVFASISLIYTTNTLSLFFPELSTYAGGRLLAALIGAIIVIGGFYHELAIHMDKVETK